jgi:hypothetical protein
MKVADIAAELIEDYHNLLMDSIEDEFIRKLVAKQCALMAVDKVIYTLTESWCVVSDKENWDIIKTKIEEQL